MNKHTPGPWHSPSNDPSRIYNRAGVRIAKAATQEFPYLHALPAEANARLIAAAPDLLEACKDAIDHLEEELRNPRYSHLHPVGKCPVLDKLRSVVKRVEG